MATNATIDDVVAGDDYELTVSIPGVPLNDTLAKAWLTIKVAVKDLDADALVQKMVTTVNVPGTGQITDDGATDHLGAVRFDLLPADTVKLVPKFANYPLFYDVQVKTTAGKTNTPLTGRISATAQVTQAIS